MTATSPAGTGSSTKGSSRSPVTAVRRTAKDWLDRPMTSWHLITGIFVLLLCFGLLMVLSASANESYLKNGSPFSAFQTQALFAVVGLFGFFAAHRLPTQVMRRFSLLAVAVSLFLLAVVLAVGNAEYGAKSWVRLGPFNLQPSELAKLALLVWMSHVLAARRNTLRSLRTLLFPVLPIFLLMVVLIMLQPDLGTTITLALVFVAVLWFGGAPLWIFGLLVAGAASGGVYLATSAGYRNQRILTWLHPDKATKDAILQIHQSLVGLGHGGIFGAGLGQGLSTDGWLPNADSDFIFAVIGEELGLIGAGLLLVLYALLAYTGLRIARRNVDPFIKIVASAATVWLVGQATINIGYVVGLLPVTGLTLPMISRGGTSLVVTMMVFGLLANFARREPQAAAALHSQGPGRMASFLGLGFGPRPPKPAKARPPRAAKKGAVTPGPAGGRATGGRATRGQAAGGRATGGRATRGQATGGRAAGGRAASVRAAAGRATSGRATGGGAAGGRPLPTVAAAPGRGGADRARSADGWAAQPQTSRRDRAGDTAAGRRRSAVPPQPPRLRRSGDGGAADGPAADWNGRAFAEPRRPRPDDVSEYRVRADGPRPDGGRPAASGAGRGRGRGRGRPVRP